jgi:hypothetical protein
LLGFYNTSHPHQELKQDLGRRKAALPHLSSPLKAQGGAQIRPQTIPCSCLPVAWITELSHQFRFRMLPAHRMVGKILRNQIYFRTCFVFRDMKNLLSWPPYPLTWRKYPGWYPTCPPQPPGSSRCKMVTNHHHPKICFLRGLPYLPSILFPTQIKHHIPFFYTVLLLSFLRKKKQSYPTSSF